MMPCVFSVDPETGEVIKDSAMPIMMFQDEDEFSGPIHRLRGKFDYRKITHEKVTEFAKSLGFIK